VWRSIHPHSPLWPNVSCPSLSLPYHIVLEVVDSNGQCGFHGVFRGNNGRGSVTAALRDSSRVGALSATVRSPGVPVFVHLFSHQAQATPSGGKFSASLCFPLPRRFAPTLPALAFKSFQARFKSLQVTPFSRSSQFIVITSLLINCVWRWSWCGGQSTHTPHFGQTSRVHLSRSPITLYLKWLTRMDNVVSTVYFEATTGGAPSLQPYVTVHALGLSQQPFALPVFQSSYTSSPTKRKPLQAVVSSQQVSAFLSLVDSLSICSKHARSPRS